MDTVLVTLCGEKPFAVPHTGDQKLEPNDHLRFVLFSNPKKMWTSVLAQSDTAFFPFMPGVTQFDSIYYVVAIAGDSLGSADSVNVADPCYSVSKRAAVRWVQKPTVWQTEPETTVCRAGCVNLGFEMTGTPPFDFEVLVVQGGVARWSQIVSSADKQVVVEVCPRDFGAPGAGTGGPLEVVVTGLRDKNCGCGE